MRWSSITNVMRTRWFLLSVALRRHETTFENDFPALGCLTGKEKYVTWSINGQCYLRYHIPLCNGQRKDESMRGERWERTFGIELGVIWLLGSPWSHVLATSWWLYRCFSAWRPARQSEHSLSRTSMALSLSQSSPLSAVWFWRFARKTQRKMRKY